MIVFQIVGYSDAGKTTVTAELLAALAAKNYQTATVKHHGHGKSLPDPDYNKDTWKHRQAGAEASLAVTETGYQLTAANSRAFPLEKWLEIYKLLEIDVVLIEGFKYADYPKVLLVRQTDDSKRLLTELTNVRAVLYASEESGDSIKTNFNGYAGSSFNTAGFINWFFQEYIAEGD
ncbi:molybdopterin-guanine dinucleotide biosynthesis protein B [Salisediminibacterium halotolerans]|uniref:Molybdopterin-guanine dinucleotide biosynthesis protein B n=1 Tax=Salisediminibacterium halotolerans TaxID=517425 RepID=A0A1H9VF18_9BACI|nr:molybdopterin-guanine dinucleotide biosynthesis protein B [Salisediminibacterium haloalkalitolerans]SES20159.1 molybdopterin-guanine dinucleotide biosynthesis protein B [Salisediminibacterium haloalkalitolerans]